VSDIGAVRPRWQWLLGSLGYEQYQSWDDGVSYRLGATYIVLEQSSALVAAPHERCRPGLNHLAFHAGSRTRVDPAGRRRRRSWLEPDVPGPAPLCRRC
jgi:hypothetical protein